MKLNGLDNFEVVCGDGFSAVEGKLTGSSPTRPSAPARTSSTPVRRGEELPRPRRHAGAGHPHRQQGAKSAERYLRGIYESVETLDVSGGYRVLIACNG